ncbi:MAG: ADP-ribosylglycohydrolase family protein [Clostridia bacterium]|nr:ADP-ribosylglycohydrolase family protein [Clostridia bacterium]
MYGAIIGDVAGSYLEILEVRAKKNGTKRIYQERVKILDESTKLFDENCFYTDDSILTVAVADAALHGRNYKEKIIEYAKREMQKQNPNPEGNFGFKDKFGAGFQEWVKTGVGGNSYGNGCAMRISAIGNLFDDSDDVIKQARLATVCSHNHPESIICSQAVALSVYFLRNGFTKWEIERYLKQRFDFDFSYYSLEKLRHNNIFSSRAMITVPQAIFCFLESHDFVSCIRNALSIGGDTDTIACISGGLAEVYYGIPKNLIKEVDTYIPEYFKPIINEFYQKYQKQVIY